MDTDLVTRARSGDHGAFEAILGSIARRFHGVAFAILRDRSLAADAAQEAMVGVWRDLPRLRDPERFDGWSYRILLNSCHRGDARGARG